MVLTFMYFPLSAQSICSIYMQILWFRSQCKLLKEQSEVKDHTQNTDNLNIFLTETSNSWWSCFKLLDLCVQSTAVMDAAYNVQWYNHSTKFKKMLQMAIMRAQRPCLLQAGPIFSGTMEHFQDVSNMSLCNFMIFFYKISIPWTHRINDNAFRKEFKIEGKQLLYWNSLHTCTNT